MAGFRFLESRSSSATSYKIKPTSSGEKLLTWWASLDQQRADRAELRRLADPRDAYFVAGFHRLVRDVDDGPRHAEDLARVALLASHVKEARADRSFPAQLARPREGATQPIFSELRMRRLLEIERPDDLIEPLRRAIRQLGGTVNLLDLAESLRRWSARTRRDWALEYFSSFKPGDKS